MPIITRNQSNKVLSMPRLPDVEREPIINSDVSWFLQLVKTKLNDISDSYDEKLQHANNNSKKKELYFEKIRQITELYSMIRQYLPMVYYKANFVRLVQSIFNKTRELYFEIYNSKYFRIMTEIERRILSACVREFEETETILINLTK